MTTSRPELAVNLAIRALADKAGLALTDVAELLHVSEYTVWSWYRKRPIRAPMMALELLCFKLKMPPHPLIKEARRR